MTIILCLLSAVHLFAFLDTVTWTPFAYQQDRCAIVRGRVVDQRGSPVDHVRVFAIAVDHPPNMQGVTATETDQKGEFSLPCLEVGPNAIYVSKESEYYPNTVYSLFPGDWKIPIVRISAGEAVNGFEVRLPPQGGLLEGRVVDSVSGKTMDTAILNLCRTGTSDCRRVNAHNAADGFSFVLPALELTLQVSAPGYAPSKPVQFSLKPGVKKTITTSLTRRRS